MQRSHVTPDATLNATHPATLLDGLVLCAALLAHISSLALIDVQAATMPAAAVLTTRVMTYNLRGFLDRFPERKPLLKKVKMHHE
jgi:hypothetical protein